MGRGQAPLYREEESPLYKEEPPLYVVYNILVYGIVWMVGGLYCIGKRRATLYIVYSTLVSSILYIV